MDFKAFEVQSFLASGGSSRSPARRAKNVEPAWVRGCNLRFRILRCYPWGLGFFGFKGTSNCPDDH